VAVDDVPRRAGILHDLGRYEEAERLLGQVLSEEPDNVDGVNTLSRRLSSSGRHEGIAGGDAPVAAQPTSSADSYSACRACWRDGPVILALSVTGS
jgi:hypothetical protein